MFILLVGDFVCEVVGAANEEIKWKGPKLADGADTVRVLRCCLEGFFSTVSAHSG